MDFRAATDVLFAKVDHLDMAEALGVSVASVRQARLAKQAAAHRSPPSGWERIAVELARARLAKLEALVQNLDRSQRPQTCPADRRLGLNVAQHVKQLTDKVEGA